MKIAFVFLRNGKQLATNEKGDPYMLPAFRWYVKTSDGQGHWEFHLFAHCSATTEDFKFQQFQGVIAFGRGKRGFWLEFCPNERVFHIGANHA